MSKKNEQLLDLQTILIQHVSEVEAAITSIGGDIERLDGYVEGIKYALHIAEVVSEDEEKDE